MNHQNHLLCRYTGVLSLLLILTCIHCSTGAEVPIEAVQEFSGFIEPGEVYSYTVPGLLRGDILYVSAMGTSGNLDPFVAVSGTSLDIGRVQSGYQAAVDREIAAGRDPLLAIPETAGRFFDAWDDDSGPG
ncbi:MAG: hypothetical protein GKC05_06365, partial [Methanomicrobiales archaeon]|nr:hypothetical protein [Methanomicrobiales archaeon]